MASEEAAAPDVYDMYAQLGFAGFMRHIDYLRTEMSDIMDPNYWVGFGDDFLCACFTSSILEARSYYHVIDRIALFPDVDSDQTDLMEDSLNRLVEDLHAAWDHFRSDRMPLNEE